MWTGGCAWQRYNKQQRVGVVHTASRNVHDDRGNLVRQDTCMRGAHLLVDVVGLDTNLRFEAAKEHKDVCSILGGFKAVAQVLAINVRHGTCGGHLQRQQMQSCLAGATLTSPAECTEWRRCMTELSSNVRTCCSPRQEMLWSECKAQKKQACLLACLCCATTLHISACFRWIQHTCVCSC